jgi:tartrate-resistant acid phosphatase type 5
MHHTSKFLRLIFFTSLMALFICPMVGYGQSASAPASAADTSKEIRFLVIGDWGRDGEGYQQKVANEMGKTAKQMSCNFVISTGDNFYEDGVKSVTDPQWKTSFEKIYAAPSLMIPWYVVLGNHDYRGNPQAQVEYSKTSTRWIMPARYFTVTKNIDDSTRVQFFFLDSTPFVESYRKKNNYTANVSTADTKAQVRWLDSSLAASTAQWKLVVAHHPVYSASPKHGNTMELIQEVKPLLEKYHVQAFINGHDHDLQHLKSGTISYLTSGGGSEGRETGHNDMTLFSKGSAGFMTAVLSAKKMAIQFIDYKGKMLYEAVIQP